MKESPVAKEATISIPPIPFKALMLSHGIYGIPVSEIYEVFRIDKSQGSEILKTILGEQFQFDKWRSTLQTETIDVVPGSHFTKLILGLAKNGNSLAQFLTNTEDLMNQRLNDSLQQLSDNFSHIPDEKEDCQESFKDKQEGKPEQSILSDSMNTRQLSIDYPDKIPSLTVTDSSYQNLSFERDTELTSERNETNHRDKGGKWTNENVLKSAKKQGIEWLTEEMLTTFDNLFFVLDNKEKVRYMPLQKKIDYVKQLLDGITLVSSGRNRPSVRSTFINSAIARAYYSDRKIPKEVVKNFAVYVNGRNPGSNPELFAKEYLDYPPEIALRLIDFFDNKEYETVKPSFRKAARYYAVQYALDKFTNKEKTSALCFEIGVDLFPSKLIDSMLDF
jgi:hypothetical protein